MWRNNYSESRDLFRQYSLKEYKNFNKQKGFYLIDNDVETSVDYLFLHNEKSKNLHILISGTHGVEGYAGSAIQMKTLQSYIEQSKYSSRTETSYLIIHGLNPYGFKNNRRCTKNNIDLNRNYLEKDNFNDANYPKIIFELISTFLFSFQFIYLFFCILLKYGYTEAREYIIKGQYTYNKGLFYGGKSREHNIEVLENILSIVDYNYFDDVYIFDIHTGLGSYGNLSIMVIQEETCKKFNKMTFNSTTQLVNMCTDNIYKESKGSIIEGIYNYLTKTNSKINIYPIILEYGTYSNLKIFAYLLLENYYYCISNDNSKWCKQSKKLKSVFYIENQYWKDLVINNYTDFIKLLR